MQQKERPPALGRFRVLNQSTKNVKHVKVEAGVTPPEVDQSVAVPAGTNGPPVVVTTGAIRPVQYLRVTISLDGNSGTIISSMVNTSTYNSGVAQLDITVPDTELGLVPTRPPNPAP